MKIRLSEVRKEKGLTQKALADRSGVSQNLIARLESGQLNNPTVDTLFKLAEALECKAESLFFENDV